MNITKETGGMVPDIENKNLAKKNNLLTRVFSALVMLPLAIFIILNGGMAFLILISFLTVMILSEWNGICEKSPISWLVAVQALCAILLIYQLNIESPYFWISFISSLISILAIALLLKVKLIWALTGFFYAVIPSASFLLIEKQFGGVLVLWMMIVIWSMDTGAYFAGKNIGGPKMSPKISPNKTWSGLIGGTITAILIGGIYGFYMQDQNIALFSNATILLLFSGLFALLSQVGDLAESAVKRKFSVKDSGSIIPGHGGVMDRVDGVLFVAPAVLIVSNVLYA
ncbi:MAG: phosphatidate cytidylyltransferase [Kordiimonadaceae bacterium]|nr:phosphatidate cytidylyltransferase [Kordiimonadaceae bacterium]